MTVITSCMNVGPFVTGMQKLMATTFSATTSKGNEGEWVIVGKYLKLQVFNIIVVCKGCPVVKAITNIRQLK